MNFKITAHAKDRYLVRTRNKYKHLRRRCNIPGCPECTDLVYQLRDEKKKLGTKIDAEMIARLLHSKENRSYLNDSEFMRQHYDKFGFSKVQFLVHGEWREFPAITFVAIENNGYRYIVTILYAKSHISGRVLRPKFGKSS